ncbi:MAG TPA: hypothetical protein VMT34_09335 [Aggregatilineales bacterium]|nr:hypothetical protein [Aggregatilineales bacterium]
MSPVYFTYDQRIQGIRSTLLDTDSVTIGDLILAWGNPKGYWHDYGTIQIDWGQKTALLSDSLTPTSPVRSILYHLDTSDLPQESLLAWRGFVTADSPPEVSSTRK